MAQLFNHNYSHTADYTASHASNPSPSLIRTAAAAPRSAPISHTQSSSKTRHLFASSSSASQSTANSLLNDESERLLNEGLTIVQEAFDRRTSSLQSEILESKQHALSQREHITILENENKALHARVLELESLVQSQSVDIKNLSDAKLLVTEKYNILKKSAAQLDSFRKNIVSMVEYGPAMASVLTAVDSNQSFNLADHTGSTTTRFSPTRENLRNQPSPRQYSQSSHPQYGGNSVTAVAAVTTQNQIRGENSIPGTTSPTRILKNFSDRIQVTASSNDQKEYQNMSFVGGIKNGNFNSYLDGSSFLNSNDLKSFEMTSQTLDYSLALPDAAIFSSLKGHPQQQNQQQPQENQSNIKLQQQQQHQNQSYYDIKQDNRSHFLPQKVISQENRPGLEQQPQNSLHISMESSSNAHKLLQKSSQNVTVQSTPNLFNNNDSNGSTTTARMQRTHGLISSSLSGAAVQVRRVSSPSSSDLHTPRSQSAQAQQATSTPTPAQLQTQTQTQAQTQFQQKPAQAKSGFQPNNDESVASSRGENSQESTAGTIDAPTLYKQIREALTQKEFEAFAGCVAGFNAGTLGADDAVKSIGALVKDVKLCGRMRTLIFTALAESRRGGQN
ncbi:hypothetical protein HK100_005702 [Physocladia obscura]|uniref:Uncharacterized protein n=1 Tax=Physocladia obscura TaxID=109957 RepID=A0AAD5SX13_9FUNG|nr:hypothetical protein HK100_005702 [Physocladia obscura]